MSYTIKIVGSVVGIPTPHDDEYIVEYRPPAMNPDGSYDGGRLLTTPDIAKAKRFPDAVAALEYWRMQNGLRPDGAPNRPLTAYTCDISPIPPGALDG